MLEGSYGKEPFDFRLTVLRMIRQLHIIIGVTLVGAIIFGGGYYVENVLCAKTMYSAGSTYHVEYDVTEEKDVGTIYVNETSWNTYLDSELFLNAVQERCETGLTNEELAQVLSAKLASDLRVPSTWVTMENPENCVPIAKAAEAVMTEVMPKEIRELVKVSLIDSASAAVPVERDVRVGRAVVLSAAVSCFFAVVFLLLKELGDDSIWLPATIRRRYGLKVVGTVESVGLSENISYLFGGKKRVALCGADSKTDPVQLTGQLKERCPQVVAEGEWIPVPTPLLCPEGVGVLREADGVLLAVKAGSRVGKPLENVLEYMEQQDCEITAVILCNADEWLIRNYYRFGKEKGV